jgi:glycyl-tRNA synthetase beta subunit
MLKDALIEFGTEEIPAGYIAPALAQMKAAAEAFCAANGLACAGVRAGRKRLANG